MPDNQVGPTIPRNTPRPVLTDEQLDQLNEEIDAALDDLGTRPPIDFDDTMFPNQPPVRVPRQREGGPDNDQPETDLGDQSSVDLWSDPLYVEEPLIGTSSYVTYVEPDALDVEPISYDLLPEEGVVDLTAQELALDPPLEIDVGFID